MPAFVHLTPLTSRHTPRHTPRPSPHNAAHAPICRHPTAATSTLLRLIRQMPRTLRNLSALLSALSLLPALPTHAATPLLRPPFSPAQELEMVTRLFVAVCCGASIGIERRAASANAGVRTLTLVSLGSAIFSLTAIHGLGGDPVRMGAAISTGIGFLGSGAINGEGGGSRRQLVTAASIWIAAALGVASAAGLFRMAVFGAVLTICVLRWRLAYHVLKRGWRIMKGKRRSGE